MTTPRRWLTILQTREETGLPEEDIRDGIASGRIPVTVIPGTSIIRVDADRLDTLHHDDAKDEP